MNALICIGLVWLACAVATAFVWHRIRAHEKWLDEQLDKWTGKER